MAKPFIILATQRTGPSWVQEMLNSHPDLKVYSELFLRDATDRPIWEPSDVEFFNTYLAQRPPRSNGYAHWYWTVRYLRRIFGQPNFHAVGFKYMYNQVSHSRAVLPYATAVRAGVLHLIRWNLLDVVISSKLASVNGIYHDAADGRPPIPWQPPSPAQRQIELDPAQLVPELQRLSRERQKFRGWLRLSQTRSCEVEYEALRADPATFGQILAFLGLPAQDAGLLTSGLRQIRTSPRSETVTNFADVERILDGTPFETYLRSPA